MHKMYFGRGFFSRLYSGDFKASKHSFEIMFITRGVLSLKVIIPSITFKKAITAIEDAASALKLSQTGLTILKGNTYASYQYGHGIVGIVKEKSLYSDD